MKKVEFFFDQEEILAYGVAFCKKRCNVIVEKLNR